jgi:HPt (histidine-containing phosphotransfer) domain-containing protein
MRRIRERLSTLALALRGRGELEDKLKLLGVIGGVMFLTLVGTLFYVQRTMGRAQDRLVEQTLPAEREIARLEATIGAAFARQTQVSSTAALAQLEPLRDRTQVEQPLRQASREIAARVGDLSADLAARAQDLERHVAEFLAADAALLASVERRHVLQDRFEVELGSIDTDLRALVEDSQAIAGMLRLEYVLVLRSVADSLARGAPRMDLVRTAVVGDVRGALDETGELANAVLRLGWLAGKLGLASTTDAINSIAANELPQNRARIGRLITSLDRRVGSRPEAAAREQKLAARYASIAPRIMDEKREGSLVSLRRQVVSEASAATGIRAQAIAAAGELIDDTAFLKKRVAALVADSVRDQERTTTSVRLFSVLVTLLGVVGCAVAARRIRQGVAELETRNQRLTDLKENLEHLNANLESKVSERTAALVERDRSMQRVLDSMTEGLATVSLDGSLRPERSRAFTAWFGAQPGALIWDVLYPDDEERAASFRAGFEQLADDIFPFDVAADQLPNRLERGDRCLELEVRAVHQDGKLDGILFVISDVTEQVVALAAEQAAREQQKIIANLLRDRRGFQRSIEEIQSLIGTTRNPTDGDALRRALHTIKGNCAVLGFSAMAELAHRLEDELELDGELSPSAIDMLEACCHDSLRRIHEFIEHARGRIEIDPGDYSSLVDHLRRREDYTTILGMVERWQQEPIGNVLHGLAGHARRLAEQMGKRIEVTVSGAGIRVANEQLRVFLGSLVHAVRNSIDHGLETPAERAAAGKPEIGRLDLSATVSAEHLIVTVADDGRGIDFDRVRQRASELGLPGGTRSDALEAIFAAGLTTRAEITQISGRGIGMGAVRSACREIGGETRVGSEWGHGTTLECLLPLSILELPPAGLAGAA